MDFMALFTMETGGHYITMLPADWSASTSHDPLTSNCHSEKIHLYIGVVHLVLSVAILFTEKNFRALVTTNCECARIAVMG